MSIIAKIRRLYLRDRVSISEISRRTSLSRTTIRKWVNKPDPEPKYKRNDRPSKLAVYKDAIVAALQVDARRPRRDRRTAKRLYQDFKAQGESTGVYWTHLSRLKYCWSNCTGETPLACP